MKGNLKRNEGENIHNSVISISFCVDGSLLPGQLKSIFEPCTLCKCKKCLIITKLMVMKYFRYIGILEHILNWKQEQQNKYNKQS